MTAGARPRAARTKRTFMEKLPCMVKPNRSGRVTMRDRGPAADRARLPTASTAGRPGHGSLPIQFRQTPRRIRAGRIGTASAAARYSRLAASTGGASDAASRATAPGAPPSNVGKNPRGDAMGWPGRDDSWQRQGCSSVPVGQWSSAAAQCGHAPAMSSRMPAEEADDSVSVPPQHRCTQVPHTAFGTACASSARHTAANHARFLGPTDTTAVSPPIRFYAGSRDRVLRDTCFREKAGVERRPSPPGRAGQG